jgi:amino acid transporter
MFYLKKHPVYIFIYTLTFTLYIPIYIVAIFYFFFTSTFFSYYYLLLFASIVFCYFFCLYCFGLNTKNRHDFFGTRCTTKTNNVKNIYSRKYDGLLSRNIALCHTKMCAVSRVFVVFC